jgi:hypothetical protein
MSLRHQVWQTLSGDPITGRAPPVLRVMNDKPLTPGQMGLVAHHYKLLEYMLKVSVVPYLVQERTLADGTRIRMVSSYGVDTVMVWPAGGGTPFSMGSLFIVRGVRTYGSDGDNLGDEAGMYGWFKDSPVTQAQLSGDVYDNTAPANPKLINAAVAVRVEEINGTKKLVVERRGGTAGLGMDGDWVSHVHYGTGVTLIGDYVFVGLDLCAEIPAWISSDIPGTIATGQRRILAVSRPGGGSALYVVTPAGVMLWQLPMEDGAPAKVSDSRFIALKKAGQALPQVAVNTDYILRFTYPDGSPDYASWAAIGADGRFLVRGWNDAVSGAITATEVLGAIEYTLEGMQTIPGLAPDSAVSSTTFSSDDPTDYPIQLLPGTEVGVNAVFAPQDVDVIGFLESGANTYVHSYNRTSITPEQPGPVSTSYASTADESRSNRWFSLGGSAIYASDVAYNKKSNDSLQGSRQWQVGWDWYTANWAFHGVRYQEENYAADVLGVPAHSTYTTNSITDYTGWYATPEQSTTLVTYSNAVFFPRPDDASEDVWTVDKTRQFTYAVTEKSVSPVGGSTTYRNAWTRAIYCNRETGWLLSEEWELTGDLTTRLATYKVAATKLNTDPSRNKRFVVYQKTHSGGYNPNGGDIDTNKYPPTYSAFMPLQHVGEAVTGNRDADNRGLLHGAVSAKDCLMFSMAPAITEGAYDANGSLPQNAAAVRALALAVCDDGTVTDLYALVPIPEQTISFPGARQTASTFEMTLLREKV